MNNTVIKVENISKQYRLGKVGLGSLSHDINRWYQTTLRGKEDPYLKIGEANDRSVKGESDYVWALQDINFEVKQGEVLGIIGRNGAGKSTLLKILSRTTTPTTGQIKIKGRVASLLEVGTGFHPELTGRENIFLNGAILGMIRQEIKSKFDEIVDFAGVERYIDTPVKRYSSGMYVRLAFGVAAHLEPEILIVDEVLAVGDAEFQKKALGKMKDVSAKDGRTVLFVSHNMAAVNNLCDRAILMVNGNIKIDDNVNAVIEHYQISNEQIEVNLSEFDKRMGSGEYRIVDAEIIDEQDRKTNIISLGSKITFRINLQKCRSIALNNVRMIIGVYNLSGEGFLRFDTNAGNISFRLEQEHECFNCSITEHINIRPGLYYVNVAVFNNADMVDYAAHCLRFSVENHDYYGTGKEIENPELAKVFYQHYWNKIK